MAAKQEKNRKKMGMWSKFETQFFLENFLKKNWLKREHEYIYIYYIKKKKTLFKMVAKTSLIQGRSQPHGSGWARFPPSSFFLKFWPIWLIFPQNFLIFILILALRVGKSPTREGPGYTTGLITLCIMVIR